MKHNILIALVILTVALCSGCTKKKSASENSPTGSEVAAQKNDFSNIYKFLLILM